jgi:hypothetical protein
MALLIAEEGMVSLELRHWTLDAYLQKLKNAIPAVPDIGEEWFKQAPCAESYAEAMGMPTMVVSILVHDMLAKQAALERLQQNADRAATKTVMALWRVKDMVGQNKALEATVKDLRQMLHEMRAGSEASEVEDLSALTLASLQERCRSIVVALRLERCKNLELIKRLKVSYLHTCITVALTGFPLTVFSSAAQRWQNNW